MNEGDETTISEFIHSQQKDAAVFDWPLQYCPDLLSEIEVPPFAALDHVETAYGPSLFISFSAKGGGPHVDSGRRSSGSTGMLEGRVARFEREGLAAALRHR